MEGSRFTLNAWAFALRIYGESGCREDLRKMLTEVGGVARETAIGIHRRIVDGTTPKAAWPKRESAGRAKPTTDLADVVKARVAKAREMKERDNARAREAARKKTAALKAKDERALATAAQDAQQRADAVEARVEIMLERSGEVVSQRMDRIKGDAAEAQVTLEARLDGLRRVGRAAVIASEEAQGHVNAVEVELRAEIEALTIEAKEHEAELAAVISDRPVIWPWATATAGSLVLAAWLGFQVAGVRETAFSGGGFSAYQGVVEVDGVLVYPTLVSPGRYYKTLVGPNGPSPAGQTAHTKEVRSYLSKLAANQK